MILDSGVSSGLVEVVHQLRLVRIDPTSITKTCCRLGAPKTDLDGWLMDFLYRAFEDHADGRYSYLGLRLLSALEFACQSPMAVPASKELFEFSEDDCHSVDLFARLHELDPQIPAELPLIHRLQFLEAVISKTILEHKDYHWWAPAGEHPYGLILAPESFPTGLVLTDEEGVAMEMLRAAADKQGEDALDLRLSACEVVRTKLLQGAG
jgi:hypothetical protein